MKNHTSDIRTDKKSPGMVRHFTSCGVHNIQPVILEGVVIRSFQSKSLRTILHRTFENRQKAREQFYIELLGTDINAQ